MRHTFYCKLSSDIFITTGIMHIFVLVIGKWFNRLELNPADVLWNKEAETPASACSLPCEAGMIKKQQGDTCCWICDSCEDYEYVHDEFTCRPCDPGYWPYPDKLSCYALDVQYLRWESLFALVPLGMACVGIIMTFIVIILFIKNHDTPLVRASGRELSYMLLFGILVCYCNTFALIAKSTIGSCILQRFGIGVGFSIIYGALLTKTNRISRIFDSASKSAQRPKYISPQSQVVITSSLIAIQVLITMIWMIAEPPGTRYYYPDRKQVILKCKIQDMSFLFSQLYNMILITICTVYAIKTRKIPENFNESKFIGFTMYTTCIIWLAFVPIYFGTGNSYEIQITTLSISISLSASVALVCLYSPKVYILVFHPDKNVRKLTMNSVAYKRSGGTSTVPVVNTGASSSVHDGPEETEETTNKRAKVTTIAAAAGGSAAQSKIRTTVIVASTKTSTKTIKDEKKRANSDDIIPAKKKISFELKKLSKLEGGISSSAANITTIIAPLPPLPLPAQPPLPPPNTEKPRRRILSKATDNIEIGVESVRILITEPNSSDTERDRQMLSNSNDSSDEEDPSQKRHTPIQTQISSVPEPFCIDNSNQNESNSNGDNKFIALL